MYDRLVADIQAAIACMQKMDIEGRCKNINHAFLLLQQLQCGLNMDEGGETAKSLEAFYLYIHSTLLEAQGRNSIQLLQALIERILQVRSAWYQVESERTGSNAQFVGSPNEIQSSSVVRRSVYNTEERPVTSWSA
jgi:flagellar protein FliS